MNGRCALALAALALGCAASPTRGRAPRYCVPTRPVTPTGSGPPPAPPAPPRPAAQAMPAAAESRVTGTTTADETERLDADAPEPPCVSPEGRIRALQGELAQGLAAVVAPTADCRAACRAATGVCAASDELCRLTGDGASPTALDPRCARARDACADASRQRADRCPVCPAE